MSNELLLATLLQSVLAEKGSSKIKKPATPEKTLEFRHLENLQIGERLRFNGGPYNSLNKYDVVSVYRVFSEVATEYDGGSQIYRQDFSSLLESNGYLQEFTYDSRYFSRIPE